MLFGSVHAFVHQRFSVLDDNQRPHGDYAGTFSAGLHTKSDLRLCSATWYLLSLREETATHVIQRKTAVSARNLDLAQYLKIETLSQERD